MLCGGYGNVMDEENVGKAKFKRWIEWRGYKMKSLIRESVKLLIRVVCGKGKFEMKLVEIGSEL
jgi:hypothetical protein